MYASNMNSALNSINEDSNRRHKEQVDRLVTEAAFAKQVNTAKGPAILLAGSVINVDSANPALHVEVIVSALRTFSKDSANG